jgi:hypothetical protein
MFLLDAYRLVKVPLRHFDSFVLKQLEKAARRVSVMLTRMCTWRGCIKLSKLLACLS